MYRLLIDTSEVRQHHHLATLRFIQERILDQIPRAVARIQEFIPGLGWRDLEI